MSDSVLVDTMRNIAAGWASPGAHGMPFTQYAQTGTITDGLADAIERELNGLRSVTWYAEGSERDMADLQALLDYVNDTEVIVYRAHTTAPGLSVDGDEWRTLEYESAIETMRDQVIDAGSEAAAALVGEDDSAGREAIDLEVDTILHNIPTVWDVRQRPERWTERQVELVYDGAVVAIVAVTLERRRYGDVSFW
jgi:hypothetical protein